jgi:hypothetical protein
MKPGTDDQIAAVVCQFVDAAAPRAPCSAEILRQISRLGASPVWAARQGASEVMAEVERKLCAKVGRARRNAPGRTH